MALDYEYEIFPDWLQGLLMVVDLLIGIR